VGTMLKVSAIISPNGEQPTPQNSAFALPSSRLCALVIEQRVETSSCQGCGPFPLGLRIGNLSCWIFTPAMGIMCKILSPAFVGLITMPCGCQCISSRLSYHGQPASSSQLSKLYLAMVYLWPLSVEMEQHRISWLTCASKVILRL